MGEQLAEVAANQPVMFDVLPLIVAVGLFLGVAVAIVLVLIWRVVRQTRRVVRGAFSTWDLHRLALGSVIAIGEPLTATGGEWRIVDPSQLVVSPNGLRRFQVAYTPDESFIASGVRALVQARETWWTLSGDSDADSVQETRTIMEVPASIDALSAFEMGRTIVWDVEFTLEADAPPTCGDWHTLSCDWMLVVSVNRSGHPDPTLRQPMIVTQPRDRLNSGVIEESEFGRYEETTAVSGPVRVDFRVHPAPLDLAASAQVELLVTNSGQPQSAREVRLELRVNATGAGAKSGSWVVWQTGSPFPYLPAGSTRLQFDVPAVNRPCPDADLLHGRLRGKLRMVIDIPGAADISVERDLCLCLDKPKATGTPSAF